MTNLEGKNLIDFVKALEKKDSDEARNRLNRSLEMLRKAKIKKASDIVNKQYGNTFKALSEQDMKESMEFRRKSWEI